RQYFIYDDQNRVASCLDSTVQNDQAYVEEYKFTYDNQGRLSSLITKKGKSFFTWNASKNTLTEVGIINDTNYNVLYKYDKLNRLVESITYDDRGKRSGR